MWLTTPETIEHVLVERPLGPASDDVLDQSARDWQRRGVKLAPREVLRNMPVVSIGQSETWTLQASRVGSLPRSPSSTFIDRSTAHCL